MSDGELNFNENDAVLQVSATIQISMTEFRFQYMRSSGPGGQNVNKVNSKVRLIWKVESSSSLTEEMKERFCSKYSRRINSVGEFQITSQRYRDQPRNREDCLNKLREYVQNAAQIDRPRKTRKPSRASKQKRLDSKKRRSDKKQARRKPSTDY